MYVQSGVQSGGYMQQQPTLMTSGMSANGYGGSMMQTRPVSASRVLIQSTSQSQSQQQQQQQQQPISRYNQAMREDSGGGGFGGGGAPPHPRLAVASEAINVAHTMHSEIKMMETTIIELQEDNEMLKWRLLQNRRQSLEKYFMADSRLLLQGSIREWDRFAQEMKRMREIDGVNSMRSADLAEYEKRLAQLERDAGALEHELGVAEKEAMDLGNAIHEAEGLLQNREQEAQQLAGRVQQLEEALKEEQDAEARAKLSEEQMLAQLAKAEKVIKLVLESSTAYTKPSPPAKAMYDHAVLKDKLHKLLRNTDQNYLPPLDKLCQLIEDTVQETVVTRQAAPVTTVPVQPVATQMVREMPQQMVVESLAASAPLIQPAPPTMMMPQQQQQTLPRIGPPPVSGMQVMRRELPTATHGAINQPLTMQSPRTMMAM